MQYVLRNLETIRSLYGDNLTRLSRYQYRSLLVVTELYRRQRTMYDQSAQSVADRIVSIWQPHVRPIVRGKRTAPVEFGAKISAAKVGRFAYLERPGWDTYNEAGDLPLHVEEDYRRFRRVKTRNSLSRIMGKRRDASETAIALAFLVMNLDTLLRQLSSCLLKLLRWLFRYRSPRPVFTQTRG